MHEIGDQAVEREPQTRSPLIIGVGAAPTALDSVERFFSKLTVGADQAVVLAVQHHEALDEPRLRRIVQDSNGGQIPGIKYRPTLPRGPAQPWPPARST